MSGVIFNKPPVIYHTPENAPTGYTCRRLFIPDSLDWLKLVNGALGTLGVTDFFVETDGGVSIDDTVAEFLEMAVTSMDGCPGGSAVIGEVKTLATSVLPAGMLWCDGSQYLRTAYPDLYAALDSAFIIDADNFVVPDLRDVVTLGAGVAHSVGDTGGEAAHTLTIDEMPEHAHTLYRASNIGTASTRVAGGASNTIGAVATTSTGGGVSHNNMPPFNTLNKAIVAEV